SPLLTRAFESLCPRSAAFTADCEFMGLRQSNTPQSLHLFDLLELDGKWIGSQPFEQRYVLLNQLFIRAKWCREPSLIRLIPIRRSPNLVSFFRDLLPEQSAEGLVVRAANHTHQGAPDKCRDAKSGMWKIKFANVQEQFIQR